MKDAAFGLSASVVLQCVKRGKTQVERLLWQHTKGSPAANTQPARLHPDAKAITNAAAGPRRPRLSALKLFPAAARQGRSSSLAGSKEGKAAGEIVKREARCDAVGA